MALEGYYRYISDPQEVSQVLTQRLVNTTNALAGGTWYSPDRYDDPYDAQTYLALPALPSHRIGPVTAFPSPSIVTALRVCGPMFGQPGGGLELQVIDEVYLPGFWDFYNRDWEF